MIGFHSRLFSRVMSRYREIYILQFITLAIAFASSVLIILFSLNEFGFDKFHKNSHMVFRVLQKNLDEHYRGNRLSAKIPAVVFSHLSQPTFKDSFVVSRLKIMNKVSVLHGAKVFHDQRIHAADLQLTCIFPFDLIDGSIKDFSSNEGSAMLSAKAAKEYTGTINAAGKKIRLYTFKDTVEVTIAAVFCDFPENSHEDFNVFVAFNSDAVTALNFDPQETGVYGRSLGREPDQYKIAFDDPATFHVKYIFQSLPEVHFGPRVLGEEARHGDRYSVIILISIASLIFFLTLSTFINLTTITLPHRSKELAIKKLAGTNQGNLLFEL